MLIFFGEDQVKSRQAFLSEKQNHNITNLPEEGSTLSDVISATSNISLFGEKTFLCVEGLFSERSSQRKTDIIEYLQSHPELDVLVWEGKDVSVQVKNFRADVLRKFDLPRHIFSFMDNPSVELLRLCLKSMPVEQIFASLVTRKYKQQKINDLLKLLELDYKLKTSQLPYDLVNGLELYIMKLNAQAFRN